LAPATPNQVATARSVGRGGDGLRAGHAGERHTAAQIGELPLPSSVTIAPTIGIAESRSTTWTCSTPSIGAFATPSPDLPGSNAAVIAAAAARSEAGEAGEARAGERPHG